MAGSIKWFVYTTDNGTDFAIKLDESNTEAINGGTQDYVEGLNIIYALPRNVRPRKVVYANADNSIRREVVCLTQTIFGAVDQTVPFTDQVSGATLSLVIKKGERLQIPKAGDTGLQDGDAT